MAKSNKQCKKAESSINSRKPKQALALGVNSLGPEALAVKMEDRAKLSLLPVMHIEEISLPLEQKTGALVLWKV